MLVYFSNLVFCALMHPPLFLIKISISVHRAYYVVLLRLHRSFFFCIIYRVHPYKRVMCNTKLLLLVRWKIPSNKSDR